MSTDATPQSTDAESNDETGLEDRQQALQDDLRELVDVVGAGPLVDLLLERSFQMHATDIHLDPIEDGLRIRLRVDGLLHDVLTLPPKMAPQVVSRVKIMAGMDITERRGTQDGHISKALIKQQRDIRVGSGPTIYGERLVLRLMPDEGSFTHLDELGFEPEQLETVRQMLQVPYGMLLAVGPVGSGKSTTTYSLLQMRNRPEDSVVTIEDPVERRLTGVNQIQLDPKTNFTFVKALRGVLRQDPDVLMIGEIRDPESAQIGVRAAVTGVTVFSTLHAADCLAMIGVFREFGVTPLFIVDALKCVVAQRLVRRVCSNCREEVPVDETAREVLGMTAEAAGNFRLAKGAGCDQCLFTGYSGRTGIFEVMTFNPELRQAILNGAPPHELEEVAVRTGLMTLEEAARRKVMRGITTIDELIKVQSGIGH